MTERVYYGNYGINQYEKVCLFSNNTNSVVVSCEVIIISVTWESVAMS